jgi:hypothetical protein
MLIVFEDLVNIGVQTIIIKKGVFLNDEIARGFALESAARSVPTSRQGCLEFKPA